MYATWDRDGIRREEVERWIEAQPHLQLTYAYRLAGREVRAVSVLQIAPAPSQPTAAMDTPYDGSESLLPGDGDLPLRHQRRRASTRAVIRQIAPPLLLTGYRRVREAYRRRREHGRRA